MYYYKQSEVIDNGLNFFSFEEMDVEPAREDYEDADIQGGLYF